MKKLALALLVAGVSSMPAWADDGSCKPEVEQACFSVHGALAAANGAPAFRIWIVRTRRILGVSGGEVPRLPDNARSKLGADAFGKRLYGDYLVCPITRQHLGWMQMVCVKDATKLVLQKQE